MRLKERLTSDHEKRKIITSVASFLNNYRNHFVGLNQITKVFNKEYRKYINIEGVEVKSDSTVREGELGFSNDMFVVTGKGTMEGL